MVRTMVKSILFFSLLYTFFYHPHLAFTEHSQLSPRMMTTGSKLNMCLFLLIYTTELLLLFSVGLVGPRKTNSNKMPTDY